MTTASVGCLDGEQAIRDALAAGPTPGPWKVVTREHAHHLGGTHIEANIFCTWDHPQLKGAMAVVATSTGIGPEPESRPIQFAYIRPADAALIAACNPEAMRALLAELDRLRSASRQEGWQPIETAPANGTFLVYMPEERTQMQVAKWHPSVKTIGNHFAFDLTAPTHWMPLPPAPAAKPQGDSNA